MQSFDTARHIVIGFVLSLIPSVVLFVLIGFPVQKAIFGFFYFLVTPFLVVFSFPLSIVVIVILFILFRRVNSCMRHQYQEIAYMLLILHWEAWGFYCSSFVIF